MSTIAAPFTLEQIEKLNLQQENENFHPFSCPNDGDEKHKQYEFSKTEESKTQTLESFLGDRVEEGVSFPEFYFTETKLVAEEKGWQCPVCSYIQTYAWEF